MLSDEDVKIYSSEESPKGEQSDGEQSAATFLRHKENGNLAKCKELGLLLAKTFEGDAKRIESDPYVSQKLSLISYIVSDELAGEIPDVLLQKSALSVFQKAVEAMNPHIFSAISDSTAYTLYILDDRQGDAESMGKTFAELCGDENNRQLIDSANLLASEYRSLFHSIIASYSFAP
ncbi:MAG: hypothetical protein RR049_05835 [Angelakisella sp.]